MFKEFRKDLGNLQVGDSIEVIFEVLPGNTVLRATGSCGCTGVKLNSDGNQVKITYKAEPIPKHLKKMGMFYLGKHIDVTVKDTNGANYERKLTIFGKVFETLKQN